MKKIDTLFKALIPKNDTLFKGKAITKNYVNRSFSFLLCNMGSLE